MLRRVTGFFVNVAERWMPDPLVIAIFLTAVAFSAALLFTDFTAGQSVEAWGNSYWSLLRFTAQMILILSLGHVLANTRAARQMRVRQRIDGKRNGNRTQSDICHRALRTRWLTKAVTTKRLKLSRMRSN